MKKIYELEIWSRPNTSMQESAGDDLKDKITTELGLEPGVVLGLNFSPQESHVENLLLAVNENEVSTEDFSSFCLRKHIPNSMNNMNSAALFLDFEYGRPLAWLHIPYNETGLKILQDVMEWCQRKGFNIQDENRLFCIIPSIAISSLEQINEVSE